MRLGTGAHCRRRVPVDERLEAVAFAVATADLARVDPEREVRVGVPQVASRAKQQLAPRCGVPASDLSGPSRLTTRVDTSARVPPVPYVPVAGRSGHIGRSSRYQSGPRQAESRTRLPPSHADPVDRDRPVPHPDKEAVALPRAAVDHRDNPPTAPLPAVERHDPALRAARTTATPPFGLVRATT